METNLLTKSKQLTMRNMTCLLLGLLLWSCTPQADQIDLDAEKAALMDAVEAYHAAGNTLDVEAIVALYTSEAKVIPPAGEVVKGKADIHQFMAGFEELSNFQATFGEPEVEIAASGDMGYSLDSGVLSFEDADGNPVREEVRDFHLWKKENGEWKLAIDIWNSPPSPASEAGEEAEETQGD